MPYSIDVNVSIHLPFPLKRIALLIDKCNGRLFSQINHSEHLRHGGHLQN